MTLWKVVDQRALAHSLQTERSMVQVCEGTKTKNDMLAQSIDQYKEMFIIARREFEKVITVCLQ